MADQNDPNEDEEIYLTEQEAELIEAYRQMSDEEKAKFLQRVLELSKKYKH